MDNSTMTTHPTLQSRLLALDTAAISDALDSLYIAGGLAGIKLQAGGGKLAGPAWTVKYEACVAEKNQFMNAGNYIDQVPAGAVIVVDNGGRTDCTSWGNILTTKAVLKGIAGSVIYGSARDIADIRQMNYPLFASNIYMVSGKNRARVSAVQCALQIEGVTVCPGDWIFGDENGVLAIPAEQLEEVIRRAENVEKTEREIINAVREGTSLDEARQTLGYHVPWEAKA
ncbi:RraA family protein [Enterobacter asburiae]|jgi:regulator of RNase E activity RraA|uniref:RraA family protein n=2 Tax=Enterobacteriaceae TaxID=543 RepID=UPI001D14A457|nr:RraA family protein [Enterobacter asburiae]MBE8905463.1 RraA family protein [Enterobacter asburiae]